MGFWVYLGVIGCFFGVFWGLSCVVEGFEGIFGNVWLLCCRFGYFGFLGFALWIWAFRGFRAFCGWVCSSGFCRLSLMVCFLCLVGLFGGFAFPVVVLIVGFTCVDVI